MTGPLRILQFGATGQLARAMIARAPGTNAEITALGRAAADLSTPGAAARRIADAEADLVLIAAAYTAVDKAETEESLAHRINAEAPGEIAAACAARGLPLAHVSTDYVFSGAAGPAWREDDNTAPLNAYGRTKLAGERAVLAAHPRSAVIRASWVFAAEGRNFVTTMLRLAETREEIAVVSDQHGRPTSANDLAGAILAMAPRLVSGEGPYGVFHFANAGATDWADFAEAIFTEAKQRGLPYARVRRILTHDYPTPAKRPENSVLDTAKIEAAYGIAPRPWRDALAGAMDAIAAGASSPGG